MLQGICGWDEFTRAARGLVLDFDARRVQSIPFPKFFNVSEYGPEFKLPSEKPVIREKVDGSLIIVSWYEDRWLIHTKGCFDHPIAQAASEFFHKYLPSNLVKDYTYLFEWTGPSNQIVIRYPHHQLILLGAFNNETGEELSPERLLLDMDFVSGFLEQYYRIPKMVTLTIEEIQAYAKDAKHDEEGVVLHYPASGLRLKIKYSEYLRVHRLRSNLTPLSVWDAMMNGDDLSILKQDLPEEFWSDLDKLRVYFESAIAVNKTEITREYDWAMKVSGGDRKKFAVALQENLQISPLVMGGCFLLFKGRSIDRYILKSLRPTNNVVPWSPDES